MIVIVPLIVAVVFTLCAMAPVPDDAIVASASVVFIGIIVVVGCVPLRVGVCFAGSGGGCRANYCVAYGERALSCFVDSGTVGASSSGIPNSEVLGKCFVIASWLDLGLFW